MFIEREILKLKVATKIDFRCVALKRIYYYKLVKPSQVEL